MKSIIVDCRIPTECERALCKMGYRVIKLRAFTKLQEPLSSHTDMLLFNFENELISTAEYCEAAPDIFEDIYALHKSIKLTFTSDELTRLYPEDCKLNALRMGRDIFIKKDSASQYIIKRATELGYSLRTVKQGYPACTTLAISENAAVTADRGMERALTEAGKTVYKIGAGGVLLPPYEYGFIGGASFTDSDKIFFFGDINTHPDAKIIRNACKSEGKEVVSLCGAPLVDLGGAIVLE